MLGLVSIGMPCSINVDVTDKEDPVAPAAEREESLGDGRNFTGRVNLLFASIGDAANSSRRSQQYKQ